MKVNWQLFSLYFMLMTLIGFLVFDHIASQILFSIIIGGLFGLVLGAKDEEEMEHKEHSSNFKSSKTH